ncbi:MAG: BrnT family toxin [Phreatobacter sp.]|uniref:BrnT family toxin n=1 Tax=Phreatobacter sp. TaxID=1966341 RepID=UPI001A5F665A|nr:BrnT family toxin [Phreatobacter sp.]MBL8570624.1 BrnT family toxin [Phreatobacter sp.]
MQFEWDENKRLANIEKHGIDFEDAVNVFDQDGPVYESSHAVEARWIAIGSVDGVLIAVVWTLRGESRRLISARRARDHEREDYARHAGGHSVR